mgnify:CR=1 FL=1
MKDLRGRRGLKKKDLLNKLLKQKDNNSLKLKDLKGSKKLKELDWREKLLL